jgi:5-methylthioadenosine/S-adenosylhomocysteine deaminase
MMLSAASPSHDHGASRRATPCGPQVALTDALVLTMDPERRAFHRGFVWMKDGRIHRVGPMTELGPIPAAAEVRPLGGRIVMPGLVNCHTHLGNGLMRGIYDEMPLEVWFAKGMWPVLDSVDQEVAAAGAQLALLELMSAGVTTTASGEICTPHTQAMDGVMAAVERAGIRACVSRIVMDSADESGGAQFIPAPYRETVEFATRELERLKRRYDSDRVTIGPEALGVLRCTSEMVQAMHALAVASGSLFTMHVASSQDERDESRRRFGHGSVSQLERLGVLGPRTLIAHGVWLDDQEVALLAKRGTGVSHNPVANAYYGAGEARLARLLEEGVRVGLGVDGASTNNSQNVWETMKIAMIFQKQFTERAGFGSAELALEMMTRGGAAAMHRENDIGSLEPGKRADVIVIDPERVALAPAQTVISNLVYSNDPSAVRDVYVNGERLIHDGIHHSLDRAAVLDEARRGLAKVLERSGLDSYIATRSRWRWQ